MTIVFSGVQPTGDLHIGNYFGAIKNFVALQEQPKTSRFFCVVDLHAMTLKHDPNQLRRQSLEITATYLAAGIDPAKSSIFLQSSVGAHTEIAWMLNCVARMGWMERMAQFKDKTGKDAERASVGLFTYPILMAADILAYGADIVPVGDDQKQHIELAKDIAQKFNNDFGGNLVIPTALKTESARIMSLVNASNKMSKSDPDPNSRINLADTADQISKKIRKATADTLPFPDDLSVELRPEVKNLIAIYRACSGASDEDIVRDFGGKGYGVFKPALAEAVIAEIVPIGERMRELMNAPDFLTQVLRAGRAHAEDKAAITLGHMRDKLGLLGI